MNKEFFNSFRDRLSGGELIKNVCIIGSAPAAPDAERLISQETIVVALNNAHRALSRIDYSFYADDFPADLKHSQTSRIGRSSPQYIPAMQNYGGLIYCGATIAFASMYWAIHVFPYSQISVFACDMVYPEGKSHFYGRGSPDPLRKNISLQDLKAKTLRLFYFGLRNNALILNASSEPSTQLLFPRVKTGASLSTTCFQNLISDIEVLLPKLEELARPALELESSGKIDWRRIDYHKVYNKDTEAWAHIKQIDTLWMTLLDEVEKFGIRVDAVASELASNKKNGC